MVEWSTACVDWESRVVAGKSLIPFSPLFPDQAAAALDIFRDLRIVDAAGQPTFGEAAKQWVFDYVSAIFGAYDHDGVHCGEARRLIQEFLLLVSKKNGKSTLAAGIMLTALVRNWRHSGEFLIIAPTIEIAGNSFNPARDMVNADPTLSKMFHVNNNTRTIAHIDNGSVLKVIAADSETVSGKKAIGVLIDELWLFGKRANAENMLREATGGLMSRPEGFTIYLSTQSDEPPAGIFKQKLDYFRDVRDGKIVDRESLGVLYEFPKAMLERKDYLDAANSYITNPNIGASVDRIYHEKQLDKHKSAGEESLRGWIAKFLNVEIGLSLRGNRWPGADYWEGAVDATLTLDELLERCEVAVAGYDGGGLDDLSGLCVLGREKNESDPMRAKWLAWGHAWCHYKVLDNRKSIASKLNDFRKAGELTIFEDELSDIADVTAIIDRIKQRGLLAKVSVDAAGLGEFVDAMASIQVTEENGLLQAVAQGWGLMSAIKTCERRLAKGTLKHCPSALMAWCVSNLKIEPTATGIRAAKQTAGDAKIDPVIGMFNAAMIMAMNPMAPMAPNAGFDFFAVV